MEPGTPAPRTPERSDSERDPNTTEIAPAKEKRVALVTGASGALGREIALRLAQDGFRIVVHYNSNETAAHATFNSLNKYSDAMLFKADVTVKSQVEAMVAAVVALWGRIDVLVNNAGINRDNLLLKMEEEDWDAVIATNLKSAYLCTRAVTPIMMRQRYGRIVNITSAIGLIGNGGQANYAAAKAGLVGFTRAIARELVKRNITANCVAPGWIKAGMAADLGEENEKKAIAVIPMARFGKPEDVSRTVSFLAAEAADYITGQVFCIDGGLVMT